MGQDGKAGLVIGVLALLGIGSIAMASRKKPPKEGVSASLSIAFYDSKGNLLVPHSPIDINEGESGTAVVTVTNTTTKGGAPWPADLVGGMEVWITKPGWPMPVILISGDIGGNYATQETKTFEFPFLVNVGYGGATGLGEAWIDDPLGNPLDSDSDIINIIEVALDYGATVDIGIRAGI